MIKKILCLSMLLPGLAVAGTVIPEAIRVPNGGKIVLSVHAKGDQIYQCTLESGNYAWQLQAPDAVLFDGQGREVGWHGAGPTWHYQDGSEVRGRLLSTVDLTPDSTISWLLLEAVEHKGKGLLAGVDFINRINTQGGLPPVSGCNGNHLGSEKRVAYSAGYVFYTK
ncbi:MAG: DUF3455 domain-containing protein [Methylococcaceae bacterium]|nr:DUF3455 domain-containing protein [Methylococcaceae bacterium]MDP3903056.1 DUF3455 domain-containing protein [Methylococcaceae bacterium]